LAARSECGCEWKWRKVKTIDSARSDQFGRSPLHESTPHVCQSPARNLIEDALWLIPLVEIQLSAAKRMLIVVIRDLREPLLVLARLDLSDNKTDTAAESVNRALQLEPRTARLSPSSVLSQPSSRGKRSRCPTHEPASRNMRIDSAAQEPTSETGQFVKAQLLVLNRPAITRVQHGFGGSSQDYGERYHPTHHR
jgi:hypothetical protein